MESSIGKGIARSKQAHRLTDTFAIIGPVLQQSRQFFDQIRAGTHLAWKIWALSITSTVFLTLYGAVLGSGFPLLSLNVAIGVPFLFMSSLLTCIPVMYLLDVLTGSQRSLAQMVTVLLTALCAAATVFFSFAPIIIVFKLTGTLPQFFVLNVAILGLATLVGLMYMIQGLIKTAIVDIDNPLHRINQRLHFAWTPLFLGVSLQVAWGLLTFYQENGGFVILLIRLLSR